MRRPDSAQRLPIRCFHFPRTQTLLHVRRFRALYPVVVWVMESVRNVLREACLLRSVTRELESLVHTVSDRGEEAWQRARSAEQLLRWPNFYVHCPSRGDEDAAPADGDSVMVLLPVANMQESGTGAVLPSTGRQAAAYGCT